MTPGPVDSGDDNIVVLRLVLASLDDDEDAHARNTAINTIANEVGLSEERWCGIALRAARMAAFFAASVHGSPENPKTRAKARTVVQGLLAEALDKRVD
jgi:hypothetical protein